MRVTAASAGRWSLGGAMILIAVVAVAATILLATEQQRYRQAFRRMDATLRTFRDRRPVDVPAGVWEEAVMLTTNACGNVCFSPEYVPLDEFRAFHAELERETAGEVDLRILDWIWDRLSRTGPHGEHYVGRNRAGYESAVRAVREPDPDP